MKITAPTGSLRKAAQVASAFSSQNSPHLSIAGALIESKDGLVTIRASNLDESVQMEVEGASATEDGAMVLNARHLLSVSKELDGDDATLSESDGKVHVDCPAGSYDLRTLDIERFPAAPERPGKEYRWSIDYAALVSIIRRTTFAVGHYGKYANHGVFFTQAEEGSLECVATNCNQLAHFRVPVHAVAPGVLLSPKSLKIIKSTFEEHETVSIDLSGRLGRFEAPGLLVNTRLIEGTFQTGWEDLISTYTKAKPIATIRAPAGDLSEGVRRASMLLSKDELSFTIANGSAHEVVLEGSSENGDSTVRVEASVEGSVKPTGLSAAMFGAALRALPSDAEVELRCMDKQILMLDGAGFTYFLASMGRS